MKWRGTFSSRYILKIRLTEFADGKRGVRMSRGWRSGTIRMPQTGT